MVYHQQALFFGGQRDQFLHFGSRSGQRLFHQHVFAGFERLPGQAVMGMDWRGDDHCMDFRVGQHIGGVGEELHARMIHVDKKEWTFATPSDICRYYGLDNNYMNSRVAGGYLRRIFGPRTSNNGRKGWIVPIKQSELRAGFVPYIPPGEQS